MDGLIYLDGAQVVGKVEQMLINHGLLARMIRITILVDHILIVCKAPMLMLIGEYTMLLKMEVTTRECGEH